MSLGSRPWWLELLSQCKALRAMTAAESRCCINHCVTGSAACPVTFPFGNSGLCRARAQSLEFDELLLQSRAALLNGELMCCFCARVPFG